MAQIRSTQVQRAHPHAVIGAGRAISSELSSQSRVLTHYEMLQTLRDMPVDQRASQIMKFKTYQQMIDHLYAETVVFPEIIKSDGSVYSFIELLKKVRDFYQQEGKPTPVEVNLYLKAKLKQFSHRLQIKEFPTFADEYDQFKEEPFIQKMLLLLWGKRGHQLNYDYCDHDLRDYCEAYPYLKTIIFKGYIKDDTFCYVAQDIGNSSTVTSFDFSKMKNHIDAGRAQILAEALKQNQHIKHLVFRKMKIIDEALNILANAFKQMKCLKSLDFSGTQISDMGVIDLGELIKENQTIEELNLCRIQMTDSGALSLAQAINARNKPMDIWYSDNPKLTQIGAFPLALSISESHERELNCLIDFWEKRKLDLHREKEQEDFS